MTEAQTLRIQRILLTTKRLLEEVGAERMTMRDLASASGVATATLYNRFETKDNIIVLTVIDHYEQSIRSGMSLYSGGPSPLQKILHALGLFEAEILRVPAFARALMSAYFKLEGSREMPEGLYHAAYATWLPMLQEMQHRRALRTWIPIELLCEELCDREFGVVMKWSQNAIADRDLLKRLKFSVLSLLLAASAPGQARVIEKELQKDHGPPG